MDIESKEIIMYIRSAFSLVDQNRVTDISFLDVYNKAYSLVIHGYGELLYKETERILDEKARKTLDVAMNAPDSALIDSINSAWETYRNFTSVLGSLLIYMDKRYCKTKDRKSVYDLSRIVFKANFIKMEKLVRRISLQILNEACSTDRQQNKISNVLQFLVQVDLGSRQLYEHIFETDFLVRLEQKFAKNIEKIFGQISHSEYLIRVEKYLTAVRSEPLFVDDITKEKIVWMMEKTAVKRPFFSILNDRDNGFVDFLRQGKLDDIKRMYSLMTYPTLMKISFRVYTQYVESQVASAREYVESAGVETIPREAIAAYLKRVLTICKRNERILSISGRPRSWPVYFEDKDSFLAPFVCLYYDFLLRSCLLGSKASLIEHNIPRLVSLIKRKQRFDELFLNALAHRLIEGDFGRDYALELVLFKEFSELFDETLVSNVVIMVREKIDSGVFSRKFQSCRENTKIAVNVMLISSMIWPFAKSSYIINWPKPFDTEIQALKKFYGVLHKRKAIHFLYGHNRVLLEVSQKYSKQKFAANLFQAVILLLFNDYLRISLAKIKELTRIPHEEAVRELERLSGEWKLLKTVNVRGEVCYELSWKFSGVNFAPRHPFCRWSSYMDLRGTGEVGDGRGRKAGLECEEFFK